MKRVSSAEDDGFADAGNRRIRGVLQRRNHAGKQIRTCNPLILMIKKSLLPNYRHINASMIKNQPSLLTRPPKFT